MAPLQLIAQAPDTESATVQVAPLRYDTAIADIPTVRTAPLRYSTTTAEIPQVRTATLRYGSARGGIPTVRTAPLRYGARAGAVPTITTAPLRYGVSLESGQMPTVRTSPLRYGVAAGQIPSIKTAPLRYGVARDERPRIRTAPLRYGVSAADRPRIRTAPLRYGVRADSVPAVKVDTLRYGVSIFGASRNTREPQFTLVRVTPLDPNNAIDPFDYRDVIRSINAATAPDDAPAPPTGGPPPQDDDTPPEPNTPEPLIITNVPVDTFFGSINLRPVGPGQWSASTGNSTPGSPIDASAAVGFHGEIDNGSFNLYFETGTGWTSSDLPSLVVLPPNEFNSYQSRSVSFHLTRQSDGQQFSLTLTARAGSDADIFLTNASGFDCGTGSGGCP